MLARFVAAPVALAALSVFPMGPFGPQAEAQGPPPASGPTIVDIALAVNEETGEFSTLIAALVEADLVEVLDGRRQFTVFAPTDAAFAKLGLNAGNIGSLPVEALTNILLYHVSPGERFAEDVISSTRIRTVSKGFLFPSVTADGVFVNQSKILAVDIDASNGVIHIIDTVLLP